MLAKCVAAGGDDFLVKPYNRVILGAKLDSWRRTAEMHATMRSQRDQIRYHEGRLRHEHEVAKRIFEKVVPQDGLSADNIRFSLSPVSVFNGDMLLASRTPTGSLYAMLGDFTGHGLPAAVGAIPTGDVFYSMTHKGFSLAAIIAETNRKLRAILPIEVFLAACYIELPPAADHIMVWNAGVPDVIIYSGNGQIRHRAASKSIPLGVTDTARLDCRPERYDIKIGDHIFMYSDGVVEAQNPDGELFGDDRLLAVFDSNTSSSKLFEEIEEAIATFVCGEEQMDDTTMLVIEAQPAPVPTLDAIDIDGSGLREAMTWRASVTFEASALRRCDPLPVLMHMVTEIQSLEGYREPLYTVLAELFNNALDHGILGLKSVVKDTTEGFVQYYQQRREKLDSLAQGQIHISFDHTPLSNGGCIKIRVQDSGEGFDYATLHGSLDNNLAHHGRGLGLVRSICRSVTYSGNGNTVDVEFVWNPVSCVVEG